MLRFMSAEPYYAYSARTVCGLLLFVCSVILVVLKYTPWPKFLTENRTETFAKNFCMAPALILFCELACVDIYHSIGYGQYISDFRQKLDSKIGYISNGEFDEDVSNDHLYSWCWTYPSMSLLLRKDSQAGVALNTPSCHNPLVPLPDLGRYYGETPQNTPQSPS